MKIYNLVRMVDVTGVSGTGVVGEVAEFYDGTAVMRWITDKSYAKCSSTAFYDSVNDLIRIHGHNGATVLELVFDYTKED